MVQTAACALTFVIVLGIAAYWDSSIRLLHVFEALPYCLAALLCLRQYKVGYLLGAASGTFWLWMAGTRTSFVRNGFERVSMLVKTGHVDRWDQFIAAPATIVCAGLIVCCLFGYCRLQEKSWLDVPGFVLTVAVVAAFFVTIFFTVAPQYLSLFRGLLMPK